MHQSPPQYSNSGFNYGMPNQGYQTGKFPPQNAPFNGSLNGSYPQEERNGNMYEPPTSSLASMSLQNSPHSSHPHGMQPPLPPMPPIPPSHGSRPPPGGDQPGPWQPHMSASPPISGFHPAQPPPMPGMPSQPQCSMPQSQAGLTFAPRMGPSEHSYTAGPPIPGMSTQPQSQAGLTFAPRMGPPEHSYPSHSMPGPPMPPPMGPRGSDPASNAYGPPNPYSAGGMPGPGMPPFQGGAPGMPPYGGGGGLANAADRMPNPIDVAESNRHAQGGGVFPTGIRGQPPPFVTTEYECQDQGSCSPRMVRSSVYTVPASGDLMRQLGLPFGLVVTPFARTRGSERPLPVSDMGPQGPVRCVRCKAYMNCHMTFIDGGRRFVCALCGGSTEVPADFFCHLDHTGRRTDCYHRPELCLGSYDLVATAEYCKDGEPPQPPAFIICLDVSPTSARAGLLRLVCSRIREEILPFLPKEDKNAECSPIRIGFITFSRVVHFYNLAPGLSTPQMQVVADPEGDAFVPLVTGFLVRPGESDHLIETLLHSLEAEFTTDAGQGGGGETVALGRAVECAVAALTAAQCPGKVFVISAGRDHTSKDKSNYYSDLGRSCVSAGCGVDFFCLTGGGAGSEVTGIAEVARLTGGALHLYDQFQTEKQGGELLSDLREAVSDPCAFDAVMRVRTSAGVRPVEFHGHFLMTNTTDTELACLGPNSTIAVDVKHDDKMEGEAVFVQVAVLYTSLSGQRRIRVHNLALGASSHPADIFRSADVDALVHLIAKSALRSLSELLSGKANVNGPTPGAKVAGLISTACAQCLAGYQRTVQTASGSSELVLPDRLKLLPLYCSALSRMEAIQPGPELTHEDRLYQLFLLNGMDQHETNAAFYPTLLPLHEVNPEAEDLPPSVRCSYERLSADGVYLLENGLLLMLWIGQNVSPAWIQAVFGVNSLAQLDPDKPDLPQLDNALSQRIRSIIEQLRSRRTRYLKLRVVRQRDPREPKFRQLLVEDRGANGAPSYPEFVVNLHQEVRALLSK